MVIGKDTPLGPSNVKASHVTSTSAIISWLPSNSNHQHVVCVNNVEVRTVKPGVYRHTITGMVILLLQLYSHNMCVCIVHNLPFILHECVLVRLNFACISIQQSHFAAVVAECCLLDALV